MRAISVTVIVAIMVIANALLIIYRDQIQTVTATYDCRNGYQAACEYLKESSHVQR